MFISDLLPGVLCVENAKLVCMWGEMENGAKLFK